ncbi:MAG TPA: molecular chaperone DnaK [bacterium]|nr:molecular chaperone DnaK [bacterium]
MSKVVGIDLGTTNSVVAIIEGGEPTVIVNQEGDRTTPSVVAFTDDGELLVGKAAKNQAIQNPDRTIASIKRQMGSTKKVKVGNKEYTPQEISAFILQKLKAAAEAYLGEPVTQAVITVPAYFEDGQRKATMEAGQIAGLEVLRILNEPTAAALAYGLDKKKDEIVMVFDLGGGTFDVSIIEIGEGGVFDVLGISGDNFLGGDDFDMKIANWIVAEFKSQTGIDLTNDKMAMQRLKDAAERAKVELSSSQKTTINLPFLSADANGPKHFNAELTRSKFEQLADDLFKRVEKPVTEALKLAKDRLKSGSLKLDEVILVGGSTRIPAVQDLVKKLTGLEPNRSVNPDEAVAVGAAIQAGVLSREVKEDIVLIEKTPLSLGVETLGGVMSRLIERNSYYPIEKTEVFTTPTDGQTSVEIHVLQGEREFARDNRTLGKFTLTGIPPAPRGVPQIEVTFAIDANGILQVKAKDRATGREQKITITGTSTLTPEEIDRMQREAEQFAEQDRQAREKVEAANRLDSLIFQIEKTLKDDGAKVSADARGKVETALATAKEIHAGWQDKTKDELETAINDLTQASYAMAEELYRSAQAGPSTDNGASYNGDGAGVGAGRGPEEGTVIDAEPEQ